MCALNLERRQKPMQMLDGRLHAVVFVPLWIVSLSHAQPIRSVDMKRLRQVTEDRRPTCGSTVRAYAAAMDEHHGVAAAFFEVSRPYSTDVDELGLAHRGGDFRRAPSTLPLEHCAVPGELLRQDRHAQSQLF